jgi:hypothetical protein
MVGNASAHELSKENRGDLTDWDVFVLRHRKRGNLAVHAVSCVCFFGGLLMAALTGKPVYLLAFFSSGIIGAAGHYLFKDGGVSVREATVQQTVPIYVVRMFWKLAWGTYQADVDQALARWAAFEARTSPRSPAASTVSVESFRLSPTSPGR